ncbi:MAG: hypothetical protein DMG04_00015 [Acidobacteria bacterium]|nr:MAG: hypothetical protein DMG04_00015 [Acidobacteriota bacterium]PYQ86282.1 MAG: hypothetical protein DMG02_24675 [Acidobacteriota bacterium]
MVVSARRSSDDPVTAITFIDQIEGEFERANPHSIRIRKNANTNEIHAVAANHIAIARCAP